MHISVFLEHILFVFIDNYNIIKRNILAKVIFLLKYVHYCENGDIRTKLIYLYKMRWSFQVTKTYLCLCIEY